MGNESALESLSRRDQLVLLGLTALRRVDETPAQPHELRRTCKTCIESADADLVGAPGEADVMRSLYRLESGGIVREVETDDRSPTGKGRPAYALDEPPEAIREAVDDDLVAVVLE